MKRSGPPGYRLRPSGPGSKIFSEPLGQGRSLIDSAQAQMDCCRWYKDHAHDAEHGQGNRDGGKDIDHGALPLMITLVARERAAVPSPLAILCREHLYVWRYNHNFRF